MPYQQWLFNISTLETEVRIGWVFLFLILQGAVPSYIIALVHNEHKWKQESEILLIINNNDF